MKIQADYTGQEPWHTITAKYSARGTCKVGAMKQSCRSIGDNNNKVKSLGRTKAQRLTVQLVIPGTNIPGITNITWLMGKAKIGPHQRNHVLDQASE